MAPLSEEFEREILTAEALHFIEKEKVSEREAINKVMAIHNLNDWKIRGSVHAILFETVRHKNLIDYIISSVMQNGTVHDIKDEFLRDVLRVGVYLIKIMKNSASLVCNTLVEWAKKKVSLKASKFVNAILRGAERFNLEEEISKLDKESYLSLKYSHPTWYIRLLKPFFDEDFIISLMEKNNAHLPTSVRVNTLVTSVDDVIQELENKNFKYITYPEIPDMIDIIEGVIPIVHTDAYKNSGIYIQSKSSILISHILNPSPGDLIYDVTAAPGSKTTHIAQLMKNRGRILAFDKSPRRIKEIKIKLPLFKIKIIDLIIFDSRNIDNSLKYKADKVLLDPPCSDTGTYSNKPAMKWKGIDKQLKSLTSIQWELLTKSIELVKPGGILVYSTCSVTVEENEMQIKRLLEEYPNVELISHSPFIGMKGLLGFDKTQRLFPHLHNAEGFFVAKMRIKN